MAEPAASGGARTPAWARTLHALPPALRHQIAELLAGAERSPKPQARRPAASDVRGEGPAESVGVADPPDELRVVRRIDRLVAGGAAWLGAEPSLAELGYWMIEPRHGAELRRQGCAWLAMFPSVDTAKRLAALALDDAAPRPVREQAIASLGARQLCAHHPATRWTAEAVQLADEALVRVASEATARGKITSEALPRALRHVASDGLAAVFARAPGLWGDSLECFASPPLARVLAISIDDIPPHHRVRVIRLIAATLGDEAFPLMLARAPHAAVGEQLEIRFLAVAFGGEPQLGALEDVVRGMKFADQLRARAAWHLQHRGVVPTVRGLRVARTTATLTAAERAERCPAAADDLGALTRFERHTEGYLYTMWGWMVRAAGDPARARELVAAHPAAQAMVRDLYFEDLARRGRVQPLIAAAHTLGGLERAAYLLAVWGRPLAALALAQAARSHTAELVCARALACYRSGRPDLTDRILVEDLPPPALTGAAAPAEFPGPDEAWRVAHAAAAEPALAAVVAGREAIIALAQPAPHDADPDATAIAPLIGLADRLDRRLPGATVYLAGELGRERRAALVAAIEAAGARVVAGPAPGTEYYVRGPACPVETIARLERQGVRRLRELEDIGAEPG